MEGRIKVVNLEDKKDSIVEIDTKITKGMVKFTITGMISRTIRESNTRIKQAFKSVGLKFPYGNVITNISPANIKKDGTHFDLPIAISILKAHGLVNFNEDFVILGELNIDGTLVPLDNPSRLINACIQNNIKNILIAKGKYDYISLFTDLNITMVTNLKDAINFLNGKYKKENIEYTYPIQKYETTINDIISQESLIRALIIAISGNHSLLIKGPIGSGKSFSVKALVSILPIMNIKEALILDDIKRRFDLNKQFSFIPEIYYASLNSSANEIFGNDKILGKISLSNFGILVFDEINIFSKKVLDLLKLQMDNYQFYDENLNKYYDYPVNSTIIGIMNPCPCGKYGTNEKCTCTAGEISRFNKKIDESLMDRFQMKIYVNSPKYGYSKHSYNINNIRNSIENAYNKQLQRYLSGEIRNANINTNILTEKISITNEIKNILNVFMNKYKLSKRSYDNIVKVARTIADVENCKDIEVQHIYEAINYQK
nr:ATP-binding protein [Helcococcus sueciensis]